MIYILIDKLRDREQGRKGRRERRGEEEKVIEGEGGRERKTQR